MVSIIIPVYNGAKYIKRTVEQIERSTYRDIEIILVDDGSTDESKDVMAQLENADSRVHCYYKENSGIAATRNFALERVQGEYICFADQDDIVAEDAYEIMLDDIVKTGADFVSAGFCIQRNGKNIGENNNRKVKYYDSDSREYRECVKAVIIMGDYPTVDSDFRLNVFCWTKMFRASFIKKFKLRFFSYVDYEDDWLFSINAATKASRICIEQKSLYYWIFHSDSRSHKHVEHDDYVENFYDKYTNLSKFFLEALDTVTTEDEGEIYTKFADQLKKHAILGSLSNETARGIEGRTIKESTDVMKNVMKKVRLEKISYGSLCRPLPESSNTATGVKRAFYIFRDFFLTWLLFLHGEKMAVALNKKVLHGRWHY